MREADTPPPLGLAVRADRDDGQRVRALRRRMQSRLCGVVPVLDYLTRSRTDARMLIASADLTGVHLLSGQPAPKPGSFHLGGFGRQPFEADIRVLAESLERYACHVAPREGRFPVRRASWQQLADAGEPVLDRAAFTLFAAEQRERDGFPFDAFSPSAPMGWVRLPSLLDEAARWVPAQWFFLGYRLPEDEPWLLPAVTTGAAAHTDPGSALASALSEAVQLDSAIGHWHGDRPSVRIEPDGRTRVLDRLLPAVFPPGDARPEFHLLPNADLPGFTVACLLRRPAGLVPQVAIGLGSGPRLVAAMYRSLLEAAGVRWLAGWLAVEARMGSADASADGASVYDLEGNVGHYATPAGAKVVEERFADCRAAPASDLPPDDDRPAREVVRSTVEAYRATGKSLYCADLTTVDVRALGFTVVRVWSPDTLTLPLPAAPPAAHPRFAAYGGFRNDAPHPYP